MTRSALQAGSVEVAYATCRDLHRRHGCSNYPATRLLPRRKRRQRLAQYGFTPTLHWEIAAQRRRHHWAGDPDAYACVMARLVGDVAFAIAALPAQALTVRGPTVAL